MRRHHGWLQAGLSFRPGEFLAVLLAGVFMLWEAVPAQAGAAPGPDSFGYTVRAAPQFTFVQITNLSTHTLYFDDDAAVTNANLGFTFNFYGSNYTNISFNVNGLMTFGGASTAFSNINLTTTSPDNNLPSIAVLWDDWETMVNGNPDGVYYKTTGTPGSRQFIVQWNRIVPVNGDGVDDVTFEARLFEGNNRILLSYLDPVVSDETTNGASRGVGATVGIRDTSGQSNNRNLQWSFNQAVITNGLNLLFVSNNRPPVPTNDLAVALEDTPVAIPVLANDGDPEGDPLTVTSVTQGTNGVVTTNLNGTVTYSPKTNFFGTDRFTYTISDGLGGSATGVVSVTVNPVNDLPTLNTPSNISINEDASLQTVNLSGIGSGATNETDMLTVTASSSNPALIPNPSVNYSNPSTTGTLTFTPMPAQFGSATISITVNDGQPSNNIVTRTFTVTVNPVNDPPTLTPLGGLIIAEDSGPRSVSLTGITTGATNEFDTLSVTAVSSNLSLIPNPIVTYTSPGNAGTLQLTPVTNGFGTALITVTVNDGRASNNIVRQTFTVTVAPVNDPPTLNAMTNLVLNEDAGIQTVNFNGVTTGATNELDTLTVTATSSNPSVIPDPTVTYTSRATNGTLKFTPVPAAFGSAIITVTVNDNQPSNNLVSRTFTVTVNPVNDPPTLDALSDITVAEDSGPRSVNLTGITTGATNEFNTLTVTAVSSNLSLIPNPVVTYTSPGNTGTLQFTPAANASGTSRITVTVNDGQPSSNIVTRTFNVTVSPVNDPPTLNPIANLTLGQNSGLRTVTLSGITSGATNETQTLTVTASNSSPALLTNLIVTYSSPATNAMLSFRPVTNATGTATITVSVSDGAPSNNIVRQSFTVTVNPPFVPPTLGALADLAVNEDAGPQTVSLTGISSTATNVPNAIAVIVGTSNPGLIPAPAISYVSPAATGTLSFASAPNAFGVATITVTVSDSQPSNNIVSRSFVVSVNPVNDLPTLGALNDVVLDEDAGPQTVSLAGITAGATNESDALTITVSTSNPGLIPTPTISYVSPATTGTLSFASAPDASGVATLIVTVSDGQSSNNVVSRSFAVTVNPVNDPPTLGTLSAVILDEDAGPQTVSLAGITSGATNESDSLSVTVTSSNPGLIPTPTISYVSPATTGTLSLASAPDAYGVATLTVTVSDGQPSNNVVSRSFTVTVNPVNDPPTLGPLSDITLDEDAGPQTVTLAGITSGATNEFDSLTVTVTSSNPGLIPNPTISYVIPDATGTFSFASAPDAFGVATLTITVSDGQPSNNVVNRSFTVTVNPVNDPPTISAIPNQTMNQNAVIGPLTFTVADVETPAGILMLSATSSNTVLMPVANIVFGGSDSNRTVTLTPATNESGTTLITVTVTDADGGAATNVFLVTINPELKIKSILGPSSGGIVIRFDGIPGGQYEVEACDDLLTWRSIGTASETAPGEFEFEDASAAGLDSRFYRVRGP